MPNGSVEELKENTQDGIVEQEKNKTEQVDVTDIVKEAWSTLTPEELSEKKLLYEKESKKLFTFWKDSSNTRFYIQGMNSVKDFDMPKELAKYNWDQVKNMMDLYNEKKPQQKIIEKDFKQIFDIYKSYVVNLPKIVVNSNETESFTTVENQKVSEFSISEQQKQKISGDIKNIISNKYQVSEVILKGIAEATQVTEKGNSLAVNFIKDQLTLLTEKGFDISKLPTLEQLKVQYKEQESKNPGNIGWAYGRALMQISHLSSQELALLENVPVRLDLISNVQDKGNGFTQGGVDFMGHGGEELIKSVTNEKNEIVNQWTAVEFFVKYNVYDEGYANGRELKPVTLNLYSKKRIVTDDSNQINYTILNDFDRKEGHNAFLGPKGTSYTTLQYVKEGQTKVSKEGDTVFISIPDELVNSPEIQKIISKQGNPTFEDMYQLYMKFGSKNEKLENLKGQYNRYEKLVNQLQELQMERKLG